MKGAASFLLVSTSLLGQQQAPDADFKKMASGSVQTLGLTGQGDNLRVGSAGGGFLVDSRHVVTSLGACCGKVNGEQVQTAVRVGGDFLPAKVVWSSEDMDIAILELGKDTGIPGLPLVPTKLLREGQTMVTLQLYLEKDKKPDAFWGPLSGSAKTKAGVPLLISKAKMVERNEGSALFDVCGNVAGVNYVFKDGDLASVMVEGVIEGVQSIGIQPSVASQPCGGATSSSGGGSSGGGKSDGGAGGSGPQAKQGKDEEPPAWRLPRGGEWIPVVLIIGVAALAFRPSARQQVARALTGKHRVPVPGPAPYPYPPGPAGYGPPPSPPVAYGTKPVLRGVAGQYAGASIALDAGPSTLGRDPHAANLVFAPESDSISKRHCSVRWDPARRTFVIEDHGSTNGTFLASGERLYPNHPRDLRPGERFYIGDLRNQFEVALDP